MLNGGTFYVGAPYVCKTPCVVALWRASSPRLSPPLPASPLVWFFGLGCWEQMRTYVNMYGATYNRNSQKIGIIEIMWRLHREVLSLGLGGPQNAQGTTVCRQYSGPNQILNFSEILPTWRVRGAQYVHL